MPQTFCVATMALVAALCLSAAASAQEGGGRWSGHRGERDAVHHDDADHRDDKGPSRTRINVFISPSGEPFRAAPGQPYPVDAWFNRADANHDGVLTEEEFVADAKAFFKMVDTNGDGVIDGFEVTNYEQKIAPEILPRVPGLTARDIPRLPASNPDDERRRELDQAQQDQKEADRNRNQGPVYTGAAVFGLIREPEPVAGADLDFDGKVSLAEFVAAARRHFAELDLDHDGRITRAELPKTPAEKLEAKNDRKRREHDR